MTEPTTSEVLAVLAPFVKKIRLQKRDGCFVSTADANLIALYDRLSAANQKNALEFGRVSGKPSGVGVSERAAILSVADDLDSPTGHEGNRARQAAEQLRRIAADMSNSYTRSENVFKKAKNLCTSAVPETAKVAGEVAKHVVNIRNFAAEFVEQGRHGFADALNAAADVLASERQAGVPDGWRLPDGHPLVIAAREVLSHRTGELPSQGWLPDNGGSRSALGNLGAALLAVAPQESAE